MKAMSDPPRLRDPGAGAPDAVRALLRHGASELPDAAQIAHLARCLPLARPAPPSAAPAASSALTGPAVGLAIALAAIGAALVHNAANARRAEPPAMMSAAAGTAAAASVDPAEPGAVAAPRDTSAPAQMPVPPPAAEAAPAPGAPAEQAGAAAKRPRPSSPDAPSTEARSEREVDLLQRARTAAPAEALSIVREHEQRFPGGALVQEREVIAVGALVGLGHAAEARARAARFVERFPTSAYRHRIEALVPGLAAQDHAGGAPAP